MLLVVNKVDLPPAWEPAAASGAVWASARTGDGLRELCDAMSARLVPTAPAPGAAVPFTPELVDRVLEARGHCQAGRLAAARGMLQLGARPGWPALIL
jgi:hypothetical protein